MLSCCQGSDNKCMCSGEHLRANMLEVKGALQVLPDLKQSNQIVEYKEEGLVRKDDGEDLEEKLRRISEQVPVRVSNTSGSSAGSGSGDFHQYRQMRRREQDRLIRMELDYQSRKEEAEFQARREERIRAAEERTAKKRARRLKKKEKKRAKRGQRQPGDHQDKDENSSSEEDEEDAQKTHDTVERGSMVQDKSVVKTPHVFSVPR
ncbi:hypothetical protein R1flu_009922 [Riccia fluitans]|uniref:Uncharacterized protein n=1 Tax=Riccia fluitans TaxID=41844 RepID=A0ABD1Z4B7_9MARC